MMRAGTWQPSPARFSAECLDGRLYSSENAVKSLWRFRGKFVRRDQQIVDRATQMSACHAGGRGFESRLPHYSYSGESYSVGALCLSFVECRQLQEAAGR
jgi:hypothetical protein